MVTKKGQIWPLAKAKAHLSEVIERSQSSAQVIQRRGKAVGVVVGYEQFSEVERRAEAGSAAHRMRSFLDAAAKIRAEGGADLDVPRREPRKSPFGRR